MGRSSPPSTKARSRSSAATSTSSSSPPPSRSTSPPASSARSARGNWSGDVGYPAVSPDGRTLLYSRRNSPRAKPPVTNGLFAVGTDGTGHHQITPYKLGGGDHANFTPDGAVLFRSYEEDESVQSQLFTVRTDGKQLHQLTHFPDGTLLLSSSASPDGKWIVIGTKPDRNAGDSDVSVLAADGSGDPQPLVGSKQWESAPDWAPE